jgi:hypothetical protein
LREILDLPTSSLKLEFCWVCKERFTEFGGKPNFFCHDHHLVPRAYGGKDGPTYSLCDSHHNALHQIALRLMKGKAFQTLLSNSNDTDRRLLWLATIVVNAKRLVGNDPNKPILITFVAKGATKHKLKALKGVYKLSNANLIELAISNLHSRHFQKE